MAAEPAESSKTKIVRDHSKQQRQQHYRHQHYQQQPFVTAAATSLLTPTSPPYPPFSGGSTGAFRANGFEEHYQTYMYPISPQFPVYADGSYPGSPVLHPQSPPMNPTSPPFSPAFHASPPIHAAYVLPHHFPTLHISSPVLTGTASIPGSPPLAYHLPISPAFGPDYRPHHQHHHTAPRETYQYHTHNVYVRGLADTVTDESFQDMCKAYVHSYLQDWRMRSLTNHSIDMATWFHQKQLLTKKQVSAKAMDSQCMKRKRSACMQ